MKNAGARLGATYPTGGTGRAADRGWWTAGCPHRRWSLRRPRLRRPRPPPPGPGPSPPLGDWRDVDPPPWNTPVTQHPVGEGGGGGRSAFNPPECFGDGGTSISSDVLLAPGHYCERPFPCPGLPAPPDSVPPLSPIVVGGHDSSVGGSSRGPLRLGVGGGRGGGGRGVVCMATGTWEGGRRGAKS